MVDAKLSWREQPDGQIFQEKKNEKEKIQKRKRKRRSKDEF